MTNPYQDSELEKAVERVEHELNIHGPSDSDVSFDKDVATLLLAAKGYLQIEKATGTNSQHLKYSLQLTRAEQAEKRVQELEKENKALRTEALKLLNSVNDILLLRQQNPDK